MRAFIAVELDDGVRGKIADIQENLRKADADIKWVKPSQIHITLRFFKDISDKKVRAITKDLPSFLAGLSSFDIDITQVGAFPKIKHPRVLWLGINNEDQLKDLAVRVENGLCRLGFPKEERAFSAHITLGRVRSPKNLTRLSEALKHYCVPTGLTQTIQHVTFFQSTLTSEGPVYDVLKKACLSAA